MLKLRAISVASSVAVLLALFVLAGSQATRAQDDPLVWARVDLGLPTAVDFTSVFMVDQNNAWLTGHEHGTANGVIYHLEYSGKTWTATLEKRANAVFSSLVAVSNSDVWAVGGNTIHHRDAGGWHEIPSPVPDAYLNVIQMFGSGQEGWIGGDAPSQRYGRTALLLHYKDGQWRQDTSVAIGPGSIQDLHFAPDGTGYAAGRSLGWRYNGTTWIDDNIPCFDRPASSCPYVLNSVRTTSTQQLWVAGHIEHYGGAPLPQTALLLHFANGSWSEPVSVAAFAGDPFRQTRQLSIISGLSFADENHGLAVGTQTVGEMFNAVLGALVLSYRPDGLWHYEPVPYTERGQLRAVSQVGPDHALAVGWDSLVLSYGYGGPAPAPWPTVTPLPTAAPQSSPPPTTRISDPKNPTLTYFPVVGHTLGGGFREYWQRNGGLAQFGYPLTEEFQEISPTDGKSYTVQYFERARFEWHPENRPPYDVLLGLLGNTVTAPRQGEELFRRTLQRLEPNTMYFPETGHNMPVQFAGYWSSHGGLPVYGYPISEAFMETSPTDGRPYLVQYFERNRLEYHPELPDAYRVSLGLLGVQVLQARGWLP